MVQFFEREAMRAAHVLEAGYQNAISIHKAAQDGEDERLIEEVLSYYTFEAWELLASGLSGILTPFVTDSTMDAIRQIYLRQVSPSATEHQIRARVDVSNAFDRVNTAAVQYAEERGAELVGMRLVDGALIPNPDAQWAITDATREWLRDGIRAAFAEGASPAEFAKSIRENQAFSKSRAAMIARTEISEANVFTQFTASVDAGAQWKRTTLSADHDHDDVCDEAFAQGVVDIEHVYPGGRKAPLFHPRCMCGLSTYYRKPRSAAEPQEASA